MGDERPSARARIRFFSWLDKGEEQRYRAYAGRFCRNAAEFRYGIRAIAVARKDDRSEDHLTWLVEMRSANQIATLELFVILTENDNIISTNILYANVSQELAGIAFSLWRAVFLSDLTGDLDDQLLDVTSFLGNLISNNSIGYSQDRGAREWTFQYYLKDARLRLQTLAGQPPDIIKLSEVYEPAGTAKEDWEIAQRALETAIRRLRELVTADQNKASKVENES